MVQVAIIIGKFLFILGLSLFCSVISIFFGIYYLIKAIDISKDSLKVERVENYFITSFFYLVLLPLLLLSFSQIFLVPAFAVSSTISNAPESGFILPAAEYLYEKDPIWNYLMILGLGGFFYWLKDTIRSYKNKEE